MHFVGQQHAEHGVVVSNVNDPIFERRALPHETVLQQLHLMQPLSARGRRAVDEMAVVVERHPVPAAQRQKQTAVWRVHALLHFFDSGHQHRS